MLVAAYILTMPPSAQNIKHASFVTTYQQAVGAVLLDVRTPAEYAEGHIEGALNIDFENPNFSTEIQRLDPSKPYFVYCRSGNRSGQAVSIMKLQGITNIQELKGGILANQNSLTLTR